MTAPYTRQIIRFNTLLSNLHIKDMKRDMIFEATGGRTEHTNDMTARELEDLNRSLQKQQNDVNFAAGQGQRRRILAICHQLPANLGFTKFDEHKGDMVVDMQRLDNFLCSSKSAYKKKLAYHTPLELSRVIVQFENMLKGYLK